MSKYCNGNASERCEYICELYGYDYDKVYDNSEIFPDLCDRCGEERCVELEYLMEV